MKLVFASDIQEIWPTQKCNLVNSCLMHGGQAVNNLNNFR